MYSCNYTKAGTSTLLHIYIYIYIYIYIEDDKYYFNIQLFEYWIIWILNYFNIQYSVDESDLQRDEILNGWGAALQSSRLVQGKSSNLLKVLIKEK